MNLDSGSGAAIERAAAAKGAKTIDYDRLTLNGKASYYVSFDNVGVGKLQGQGIVSRLKASGEYGKKPVVAELNGSPDRQQRDAVRAGLQLVLNPLYAERPLRQGPEPVRARLGQPEGPARSSSRCCSRRATRSTRSPRPTTASPTRSITALKATQAQADPGLRPGRHRRGRAEHPLRLSSADGVQGRQAEANAAAKLAIALVKGQHARRRQRQVVNNGTRNVPSVLLKPLG